ncbi:ZIP family metal transporter [Mycoplasmopsis synoviae]|uniref:Metal transporter n=2 Tax=Mycoplasmopsis synoviae TaxID=2109 RepID=Q4A637_MYCS5|nr:ZIP family metal transporter [Mycoplasmopsis synoviae]AAZ43784.1 conserved hypothetical protein [Mycoplasmopsis synoviae 53]MBD5788672.1 hypothetical protein [Mycoplasmopsis synoviae GX11-T]QGL44993.1 hypothetical protein EJ916_00425 [Mycoplasmopsis synoviae]QXV99192.1 ZIP family metal transporter [Mycoplasmopsis synoviae]UBX97341.1 ZIP family metal transporter [Mycoplasmopsis synoviae]
MNTINLRSIFPENTDVNIVKFAGVLIFAAILLVVPLIIALVFPLIKKKLNSDKKIYLYAFSSGFFIMLATIGFIKEGLENAIDGADRYIEINRINNHNVSFGIVIPIMTGGIILGIAISYLVKYVFISRFNKVLSKDKKASILVHDHGHGDHKHKDKHPDFIFNQSDNIEVASKVINSEKTSQKVKIVALVLLLTHRVFVGLLFGWSINQLIEGSTSNLTWAFIISFWLHLIPEELVFYYRLREAGYSRWKSFTFSVLGLSILIPFMIIGVYGANFIESLWWLRSLLYTAIGGIFLFNSLVEFFPEFYHVHFIKQKKWHYTLLFLFAGIILGVFILSFHMH